MSGRINGVSQKIISENPKAIYIHCLAHTLNLCLQDSSSICRTLNEALSLTSEIATFICASPKRLVIFQSLQKNFSMDDPVGIKPLCPTRWTIRTSAIQSVITNYSILSTEFEIIARDSNSVEASRKACGLLAMMDKFSFYFGLKVAHIIFAATEQVSKSLQKKDITAQEAIAVVKHATRFLTDQRSDACFSKFYDMVTEERKNLTEAPKLPRQRTPNRYNDGGADHIFDTPADLYCKEYYDAFDVVIAELNHRFDIPAFSIMKEMESILLQFFNGVHVSVSDHFCTLYKHELNLERLKVQLLMLPDLLKTANEGETLRIRTVTSIGTVIQLMNLNSFSQSFLSEVNNLLNHTAKYILNYTYTYWYS